jgi:DNA-binding transcriptional MerR regulator
MAENHYLISEASKKVNTEAHVLRYWEEELGIEVPRNEMGHRYYTDEHIQMFKKIIELKAKGYQLKAIKDELTEDKMEPKEAEKTEVSVVEKEQVSPVVSSGDKMEQFHTIMTNIVSQALAANNEKLGHEVSGKVSERVIKEMNFIMRLRDEKEEERFKKLDETLRSYQKNHKARAEAAATVTPVVKLKKKKRRFLSRKKS